MLGSLRAYARHRDVSLKAVQKARDSGRIVMVGDKVDFEASDARWKATTDLAKPRNSVTGHPKATRSGVSSGSTAGQERGNGGRNGVDDDLIRSYGAARAVRETYLAKIAELEYETRRGELVDRTGIKRAIFASSRRLRDAFNRHAEKCAAQCDRKTSAVVFEILSKDCRKILEDFARGLPEVTVEDVRAWLEELELEKRGKS